jgi:hypothetical protein
LAIAFFYAVGTGLGGIIGPVLFGHLIATKQPADTAIRYVIGAGLVIAAGLGQLLEALLFGVDPEGGGAPSSAPVARHPPAGPGPRSCRRPPTRGTTPTWPGRWMASWTPWASGVPCRSPPWLPPWGPEPGARGGLRDGLVAGRIRRLDRDHYTAVDPSDAKVGARPSRWAGRPRFRGRGLGYRTYDG